MGRKPGLQRLHAEMGKTEKVAGVSRKKRFKDGGVPNSKRDLVELAAKARAQRNVLQMRQAAQAQALASRKSLQNKMQNTRRHKATEKDLPKLKQGNTVPAAASKSAKKLASTVLASKQVQSRKGELEKQFSALEAAREARGNYAAVPSLVPPKKSRAEVRSRCCQEVSSQQS